MKWFVLLILIMGLFLCAFLGGCGGIGFNYQKKLHGNFYIIATDVDEQMCIAKKTSRNGYSTIVDETVYEVGYDSNFIVAIQHPMNNKNVNAYYIVKMDSSQAEPSANNTFGPLTFQQFYQKRKDFGIEDIGFSLVFAKLK